MIRRYAEKISGPIRDRIDITQGFLPLRKAFLKAALQRSEPSARPSRSGWPRRGSGSAADWPARAGRPTARCPGTYLRQHLPLPDGLQAVDEAYDRGRLSARGVDKVLRLMLDGRRSGRPGRARPRRRGDRAGHAPGRAVRDRRPGGGLTMAETERRARLMLSCAMDGGDPAGGRAGRRYGRRGRLGQDHRRGARRADCGAGRPGRPGGGRRGWPRSSQARFVVPGDDGVADRAG